MTPIIMPPREEGGLQSPNKPFGPKTAKTLVLMLLGMNLLNGYLLPWFGMIGHLYASGGHSKANLDHNDTHVSSSHHNVKTSRGTSGKVGEKAGESRGRP